MIYTYCFHLTAMHSSYARGDPHPHVISLDLPHCRSHPSETFPKSAETAVLDANPKGERGAALHPGLPPSVLARVRGAGGACEQSVERTRPRLQLRCFGPRKGDSEPLNAVPAIPHTYAKTSFSFISFAIVYHISERHCFYIPSSRLFLKLARIFA
jgi:hypothetical protein